MASAIDIEVPVARLFQREVLDTAGVNLSAVEADELVARFTERTGTTTAPPYICFTTGRGFYATQQPVYLNSVDLSSTGTDDHVYLCYGSGIVRALTVIRTTATTTANPDATANLAEELTNSSADFVGAGGGLLDVTPGDIVILTDTGSTAVVTAVDDTNDQLATTGLDMNQTYSVGRSYIVARAPGTDTNVQHTITGRRVDWRGLLLHFYQTVLRQKSLMNSSSVGSATMSPETSVGAIRQRIEELRGVIGGPNYVRR